MKHRQASTRIPLLWILAPFMLGLITVHHRPLGPPLFWLSLSFASFSFSYFYRTRSNHHWHLTYSFASLFLGIGIHSLLDSDTNTRIDFPPREATLTLEIQQVYSQSGKTANGIARILDAPDHLADYKDLKIYYKLFRDDPTLILHPTSQITARAILQSSPTNSAPHNDFQTYLNSLGIWGSFTRGPILEQTLIATPFQSLCTHARDWAQTALLRGLDPNTNYAATFTAMTLGLRRELSSTQKDTFLKSGVMHLFAISGLHIGIIAACIHALLQIIRTPRRFIPISSLILITFFVSLTGGSPSAWRALLMVACYYLCQSARLQSAPLNALVLSALICLLIDPRLLFQAGFQMSYATVAAILLYGVPLAQRTNDAWHPFEDLPKPAWNRSHHILATSYKYTINLFCISFSTSLVSGFFSLAYFNTLPIAGIALNFLLLPFASLAIIAGFCSLFASLLFIAPLSSLFNHAAAIILFTIENILNWLTQFNFTSLQTPISHATLLLPLIAITLTLLTYAYSKNWPLTLKQLWFPPVITNLIALIIALW